MKTLLLKLSGPLQSWGTSSHFNTRYTDYHPSKSGLIGIIAASLGLKRDQEEEIRALNQLDFAVRVDQAGNLLKDFHTAKSYKKDGQVDKAYVTNRYYLEDAVFLVGLGHEDDSLIDKIDQALRHPYFQPFMGRKSLPLPYDFIIGKEEGPVLDTLKQVAWQASDWYRRKNSNKLEIYADADLVPESETSVYRQDRVQSFSRKDRKFGFRGEVRLDVYVTGPDQDLEADHDAFGAI